MKLFAGDVVVVDLGVPIGSEAGFVRPAVVVSAAAWLDHGPSTAFVVPLTTTKRTYPSHVEISPDDINGLDQASYAQVEHLRSVAFSRLSEASGNVGPSTMSALRDVASLLLGL